MDQRLSLLLILFSLFFLSWSTVESAFPRRPQLSQAYIEEACSATRYPTLCVKYLSRYANTAIMQGPEQLAHLALSESLYRALYTKAYILKVAKKLEESRDRGCQEVKDCLAQISDTVIQLGQSIRQLRRLGDEPVGDDFFWHISNVETWVSAALTDTSTCLDELPGQNIGKTKATIKGKVLNVAQATSNALALFHRYAAKYKVTTKNL